MIPDNAEMDTNFRNGPANVRGIRIATIRFGAVFWISLIITASFIIGVTNGVSGLFLFYRFVDLASLSALAVVLSYLLFALHERLVRRRTSEDSLPLLVVAAFVLSLALAVLWAGAHVFYPALAGIRHPMLLGLKDFMFHFGAACGIFFAWGCLFVALLYAFELNARKLRLAAIREEALNAQMRALRYQVNPHFLFNTLNSIAGLIEEGAATQADRMVLSLSTFLRTTLALDPFHDVPLAEEIALQEGYLGIERVRFSDRMDFTIDLEADAGDVLVPSLILQPLIENAIKHGVGMTRGSVAIGLQGYRQGDRLCIAIVNDMPGNEVAMPRPAGVGVGLKNVGDRLQARFGDNCLIRSGPIANGRFKVLLELPWRTVQKATHSPLVSSPNQHHNPQNQFS